VAGCIKKGCKYSCLNAKFYSRQYSAKETTANQTTAPFLAENAILKKKRPVAERGEQALFAKI